MNEQDTAIDFFQAFKDAFKQNTDSTSGNLTAQGYVRPCPSCGHCPTCGRGGYHTQPYWWYVYPTYVTCGTPY